jgi:hypothetical protein
MVIAEQLVEDAGFELITVEELPRARESDDGSAVYARGMTAAKIRKTVGLK